VNETTRTQNLYEVTVYWLDGKVETLKGWGAGRMDAAADAFNSAGYGAGALRAVDYWDAKKVERT
jgi:hypothetical protein